MEKLFVKKMSMKKTQEQFEIKGLVLEGLFNGKKAIVIIEDTNEQCEILELGLHEVYSNDSKKSSLGYFKPEYYTENTDAKTVLIATKQPEEKLPWLI